MKDFNPLDVTLFYVVTGSPCCKGTRTSGTVHQGKKLIPEQRPGDPNPLFQLVIDPYHPPTWQN